MNRLVGKSLDRELFYAFDSLREENFFGLRCTEINLAGIFYNFSSVGLLGSYVRVQIYQHPPPENKIGSNHRQFALLGGQSEVILVTKTYHKR